MIRFKHHLTEGVRLHGRFEDGIAAYEVSDAYSLRTQFLRTRSHDLRGAVVDGKFVCWDSYDHTHNHFFEQFGYETQNFRRHITIMAELAYGKRCIKVYCRHWDEVCRDCKYLRHMVDEMGQLMELPVYTQ